MDAVYNLLTQRVLDIQARLGAESQGSSIRPRILIAFAGPPGSGKSTISAEVVRRLNRGSDQQIACVVPMDGFHYPRKYLDALPNHVEAYARRGIHWTFDGDAVLALVQQLHDTKGVRGEPIFAPSFDHALKDPVKDAIRIDSSIEIAILEGNWLLYDQPPWSRIPNLVDETWFVDVEPGLARDRIARRHIKSGIEQTWEAAVARAEQNDLPNGEEIRQHLLKPDVVVQSLEWPHQIGDKAGKA